MSWNSNVNPNYIRVSGFNPSSRRRGLLANMSKSILLANLEAVGAADPLEGEHGYQRNMIKLNRALEQYFSFTSQTATSDYEWSMDFYSYGAETASKCLLGNASSDHFLQVWLNNNENIATKTSSDYSHITSSSLSDIFHTLNVKLTGTAMVIKLDGVEILSTSTGSGAEYSLIGNGILSSAYPRFFEGYIKDLHLISGFPENKLFKLDETLVGSSDIVDSNGGSAGVMVNGGAAYSEPFTLNTKTTPHVWSNADKSVHLPIFGTVSTALEGEHGYQRNLIKLNKSLNQYFTFGNQLESGDFEIQLDYFSDYSGNSGIVGLLGPNKNQTYHEAVGGVYIAYHGGLYLKNGSNSSNSIVTNAGVANFNEWNTLNIKVESGVVTIKINNVTVVTADYLLPHVQYGVIGGIQPTSNYTFEGYIANVHLISGFPENKLFKLDETLVGSNNITDSNGGSAGIMVNGGSAYSERFTLNTNNTPHVYSNDNGSVILPIAGTTGTEYIPLEGEHGYQRNIIKLNRSLEQYFTFVEQIATGNYEWSLDFCVFGLSNVTRGLLGNPSSDHLGSVYLIVANTISTRISNQYLHTSTEPQINIFHTLNVKQTGANIVITLDDVVIATASNTNSDTKYSLIGNGVFYNNQIRSFDGYIKNVHLISGFPENKLFKLDEDLVSSNAIEDSNGGSDGSMVNGGSAYSERFTLNTSVSPNVYVNDDASITLPIAGT